MAVAKKGTVFRNAKPFSIVYIHTPWPESASEQYRPSDRRVSAK
jgi:hypothetical protein